MKVFLTLSKQESQTSLVRSRNSLSWKPLRPLRISISLSMHEQIAYVISQPSLFSRFKNIFLKSHNGTLFLTIFLAFKSILVNRGLQFPEVVLFSFIYLPKIRSCHFYNSVAFYRFSLIYHLVAMFANGTRDLGSIPGRVIAKTLKMVFDISIGFTLLYFKMDVMPLVPKTKMADFSILINLRNLLARRTTWLVHKTTSATSIFSPRFWSLLHDKNFKL